MVIDAKKEIELLSRLLADTQKYSDIKLKDAYQNLLKCLEEQVNPRLATSFYNKRDKLLINLSRIIEAEKLWLFFPDLIGRRMIGIQQIGKKTIVPLLQNVFGEEILQKFWLDRNIPILLLPKSNQKKIGFVNTAGHFGILTDEEFEITNQELWRKSIEINQLLETFVLAGGTPFHQASAVWLPCFANSKTKFYQQLKNRLDVMFYITLDEEKYSPQYCQNIAQDYLIEHIPVFYYTGNKLILFYDEQVIEFHPEEFATKLYSFDTCCYPDLFTERLKIEALNFQQDFLAHQKEKKQDLLQMVGDLTFVTQENTKKAIIKWREARKREQEEEKKEGETLTQAFQNLFYCANEFQKILLENKKFTAGLKEKDQYLLAELLLKEIDCGNFADARKILRRLQVQKFRYNYVLELIYKQIQSEDLSPDSLERLRHEQDNQFIRRLKLRLLKELNFSDWDGMQIARDIHKISTAKEFYYRGLWLEHEQKWHEASKLYRKAYELGYKQAGEALLHLTQNVESGVSLDWLATQLLIPEACLAYGQKLIQEKRFYEADFYLKTAAGGGNITAIRELSLSLWRKLNLEKKHNQIENNLSVEARMENCRQLFLYLLKKTPNDSEILTQLGFLYWQKHDGQRALDCWKRAKTPRAKYQCGVAFQYGNNGVQRDFSQAKLFYQEAKDAGYMDAEKKLEEIIAEIKQQEVEKEQKYHKNEDYTSKVEIKDKVTSDSGCFITTAVCQSLGKGDNCAELTLMRQFRDQAKAKDPLLAQMIKEYYRIAPIIIKKINSSNRANQVYADIWTKYLATILSDLKNGRKKEASLGYIQMVETLSKTYKISFVDGISEAIVKFRQRT